MRALGIVLGLAVLGMGVHIADTQASAPTYRRLVQTVTLRGYVCDVHKPQARLIGPNYFAETHCLLASFPLATRPISMDYEWQAAGFPQWWSSSDTLPVSMAHWNLRGRVHIAWANGRVVLFGPMTASEGTPNYSTRLPDATIQFEAVYQTG